VSSNSSVGLTVIIPFGALSSNQTITVTALAGDAIAYRFEPHLTFSKNVTLSQNLAGTDVNLLSGLLLEGGHFPDDTLAFTGLLALVDETVPANILSFLLSNTAVFKVGHFSGWILASGRECEGSECDGY
jgi:hypothetical protein